MPQERVGRPAGITEEFLKKLLELEESDPRDLGYPFSAWTAELLAVALREQTELEVCESSVRRSLHGQGYSVQRPVLSVSSPDPEYEQKSARLQELQRRTLAGEFDLYYEDEVDLALLPGVMRGWSKQGQQRKIETPRQNHKHYGTGLIQRVSGKLYWAPVTTRKMPCIARCWRSSSSQKRCCRHAKNMWWWIIIASTLPNRYKSFWLSIRMRSNWSACPPIRPSSIRSNASGNTCVVKPRITISSRR